MTILITVLIRWFVKYMLAFFLSMRGPPVTPFVGFLTVLYDSNILIRISKKHLIRLSSKVVMQVSRGQLTTVHVILRCSILYM